MLDEKRHNFEVSTKFTAVLQIFLITQIFVVTRKWVNLNTACYLCQRKDVT